MFSLGSKVEGDEREHHNSRFDVNDQCLPYGAAILAETTLRYCNKTVVYELIFQYQLKKQ